MAVLSCRAAVASAAVLICVVSGCGDNGTVTQQSDTTPTPQTALIAGPTSATPASAASTSAASTSAAPINAPVETRAEILLLQGAQLDGQQFDLAATAGNDVVLWFWAPW